MLDRVPLRAEPSCPALDVEVVRVLPRAAQHRRELVKRLEQLAGRLAQRFLLEAVVARTHVLEDRLLGARSDDRLALPPDEDVGALTRSAPLLDRCQTENPLLAPVFSVTHEDH